MEYIGLVVGILLFVLGIKMMDNGSEKSEDNERDSMPIYQQPWNAMVNYNRRSEPNNWTYFFGKIISTLAAFLVLLMILFLVGLF